MKHILTFLIFILSCTPCYAEQLQPDLKLLADYENKDKESFIENFPSDFDSFTTLFGYDEQMKTFGVLSEQSNELINYFFSIANKNKLAKVKIDNIVQHAIWDADAPNYLQHNIQQIAQMNDNSLCDFLVNYNNNQLNNFASFYFSTPYPKSTMPTELLVIKEHCPKSFIPMVKGYVLALQHSVPPAKFNLTYSVIDPDGETNLRSGPTANSTILYKVKSGAVVKQLFKSGDWLLVESINSENIKIGYLYAKNIKLLKKETANLWVGKYELKKIMNNQDTGLDLTISDAGFATVKYHDSSLLFKVKYTQENPYRLKIKSKSGDPIYLDYMQGKYYISGNPIYFANYSKWKEIIEKTN